MSWYRVKSGGEAVQYFREAARRAATLRNYNSNVEVIQNYEITHARLNTKKAIRKGLETLPSVRLHIK